MPFIKRSGVNTQISSKLRDERKKIIEEERIRILGDALMLFYDKLMEKYELVQQREGDLETDEIQDIEDEMKAEEIIQVSREEVEAFAQEYAATKPTGY